MPLLHLGSMLGTDGTQLLQNPLRWACPRHRRPRPFLNLSWRHIQRPWARHPVHPVVVVFFLFPTTHPAIASTIRTLFRTLRGQGGEEETNEHTYHKEPTSWRGAAEKHKETGVPEWRAAPKSEEYPSEPTSPRTGMEEDSSSLGNINSLKKNNFTSPRRRSYAPSHSTDTCTVSPVKVAPCAPPTMAPPACHLYKMPMVQNSYTKAVEKSDMPRPHFDRRLQSYDEWVEKLQQWLEGCDPTYRKANEAGLILSTLPPWLKGIINTGVGKATPHTRTAPTIKELWDFLEHCFDEYDPSRADERW